jgi:hypothetical protein
VNLGRPLRENDKSRHGSRHSAAQRCHREMSLGEATEHGDLSVLHHDTSPRRRATLTVPYHRTTTVETGEGPGNNPRANAYEFVGRAPSGNGFGKAGGLGAIAYQAANAPIQIGNLVWFDGDRNGVQDPADVRLPGATINLLDATGKHVATTKTDAAGEYYFGGVGAAYKLTPGAKYTVQFNVCTADTSKVPGQPPATDLRFTLGLPGEDRVHDSNVVPPTTGQLCNGHAPVTAPDNPGKVDHTIDAGMHIPRATADHDAADDNRATDDDPGPDHHGSNRQEQGFAGRAGGAPAQAHRPQVPRRHGRLLPRHPTDDQRHAGRVAGPMGAEPL